MLLSWSACLNDVSVCFLHFFTLLSFLRRILGGVDPYGTQLRGKLSIQERDLLLRNLLQRAVNMNASAPTPWGSTRSEKIRVRSDSYMCCQQEGCSSEEDCMGRAGAGTF